MDIITKIEIEEGLEKPVVGRDLMAEETKETPTIDDSKLDQSPNSLLEVSPDWEIEETKNSPKNLSTDLVMEIGRELNAEETNGTPTPVLKLSADPAMDVSLDLNSEEAKDMSTHVVKLSTDPAMEIDRELNAEKTNDTPTHVLKLSTDPVEVGWELSAEETENSALNCLGTNEILTTSGFNSNNVTSSSIIQPNSTTPKRTPHPDCKLSLEEVEKMSQKLKGKKNKMAFVHSVYIKGGDPVEIMKNSLLKDSTLPRKELRKMSRLYLPKIKRRDFYLACMKGIRPEIVLRRFLKQPHVQQWLLCSRLQLTDDKLLSKQFHLPANQLFGQTPMCRPLKEWFHIFLQESSIEEAIGRVKNVVARGTVVQENSCEAKPGPCDHESTNPSCDKALDAVETTPSAPGKKKDLQQMKFAKNMSKKARAKHNKKFQKLNEDQMKVYNSWRKQGLAHFDALNIVMKFPRVWAKKPINARKNVPKHNAGLHTQNITSISGPIGVNAPPNVPLLPTFGASLGPIGPQTCGEILTMPPPFLPNPAVFGQPPPPFFNNINPAAPVPALNSLPSELPGVNSIGVFNSPFPQQPIMQIPPVIPPYTSTGVNTLARVRVPQKSTFIEDVDIPLQPMPELPQPEQHPSSPSSDSLQLFIVPPEYPKEVLSDEEIDAIEKSIQIAVLGIEDVKMKPIFDCLPLNGKYKVVCKDELAKKWLHRYVKCMYPVVALKIIPAEPVKVKISIVLPLCKNEDTDKIIEVISSQNMELNVGLWDVIQRCNDDENTTLSFLVDEEVLKGLTNFQECRFKTGRAVIVIDKGLCIKNRHSVKLAASVPGSSTHTLNMSGKYASSQPVEISEMEDVLLDKPIISEVPGNSTILKKRNNPTQFDDHPLNRTKIRKEGKGYAEQRSRGHSGEETFKPSKQNHIRPELNVSSSRYSSECSRPRHSEHDVNVLPRKTYPQYSFSYHAESQSSSQPNRNISDFKHSVFSEPEVDVQPRRNSSDNCRFQYSKPEGNTQPRRNSSDYSLSQHAEPYDTSANKKDGLYKNGRLAPRRSKYLPSPNSFQVEAEHGREGHFGRTDFSHSGSSKTWVRPRPQMDGLCNQYGRRPVIEPLDVSEHSTNQHRAFKKSYADFLQHPQGVPLNVLKDRLGLERAVNSSKRSPSPDFDELLKSAKSHLNLPTEPTIIPTANKSSKSK